MVNLQKEKIYSEYKKKVFGYIQSHVANLQIAEDLTSDVFVKVFEKFDRYDEKKASLSTWIYLITKNTLIDYFRVKREASELTEMVSDNSSVEDEVCNNEMLCKLAAGLKQLDSRERNIIILHFYSGKTMKEISAQMGISYSYTKLLEKKAFEKLKAFF